MKGWMRVAAVTPRLQLGDVAANAAELYRLMDETDAAGADVVVFPELALTGATLADGAGADALLEAAEQALVRLARHAATLRPSFLIGFPLKHNGAVYDVVAVLNAGQANGAKEGACRPVCADGGRGEGSLRPVAEEACSSENPLRLLVARRQWTPRERRTTHRAFRPWLFGDAGHFAQSAVPLTSRGLLTFCASEQAEPLARAAVVFAPDLEDGARLDALQQAGVTVLLVPAATPAYQGSFAARQAMLTDLSRRGFAVVWAGAGSGESGAHALYTGERLIAEAGRVRVAASELTSVHCDAHATAALRAAATDEILYYDLDVDLLEAVRREAMDRRGATFEHTADGDVTGAWEKGEASSVGSLDGVVLSMTMRRQPELVAVDPAPLVPEDEDALEELLRIQAAGLARRMTHLHTKDCWLGLSGGLDSTLAFLVALRAFETLDIPLAHLHLVSMPAFGTGKRTRSNAQKLGEASGADFREILLTDVLTQHFRDIGLPPEDRSVAFENAQARERTQILMDLANLHGGLQLGTGDLSEVALGWSTYNGDHMAMYNPNGSVSKTLARALVAHEATKRPALAAILIDIIDTPISPELLPGKDGVIAQKTEDIVGDYRLHDFFIATVLRYGFSSAKVVAMAEVAFAGVFDRATIEETLAIFLKRVRNSQFKRNAMPDGVAVSPFSLTTDDFLLPSDLSAGWGEDLVERGEKAE